MDPIVLGTGSLTWHADERRIDRYGTVHLNRDADGFTRDLVRFDDAPVGTRGQLVAIVLAVRPAFHAGDLVRGAAPSDPAVGEEIPLGTGTLFVEPSQDGNTEIGVRPDDGRSEDWLDPTALTAESYVAAATRLAPRQHNGAPASPAARPLPSSRRSPPTDPQPPPAQPACPAPARSASRRTRHQPSRPLHAP
ncbi:hypothetical protein LX83_006986 [Goodfellowiella coeruleoviolacea]|uniref:Uncharacterized protein n=1 Tax=Goodfellowiella coeruleoviolacea TaxID=334858 RepID=A0AAE3GQ37_9PSEU|nr:hypothetical protein [Goodfellowiella coeruleoviolacea]